MEIDAGKVRHLLTIITTSTASVTNILHWPGIIQQWLWAPSPPASSAKQEGCPRALDTIAAQSLEHRITSQARLSPSITHPSTPSTCRSSFKDNTTSYWSISLHRRYRSWCTNLPSAPTSQEDTYGKASSKSQHHTLSPLWSCEPYTLDKSTTLDTNLILLITTNFNSTEHPMRLTLSPNSNHPRKIYNFQHSLAGSPHRAIRIPPTTIWSSLAGSNTLSH